MRKDEEEWIKIQLKDNPNNKELGWDHPVFKELKKKEEEFDLYIRTPLEVVEGVLKCKKCNSSKVLSFQTQTRSADEPMTTVAKCSRCNTEWTENN